ncbi:flippase [Armatimonas rosea]|uniref:O-antigen/teichoic acid export membrane protein n=1 Tax=Armatimonas rosea TaxID=685828 RepID=A0A7W9W7G3_ARMRO|nr:flippase [Armatimonas rosea]MBB6051633.1 O-antigen/teichoic acid export membrane protein [Armatimonas rosea]
MSGMSARVAKNIVGTLGTQLLTFAMAFLVNLYLPRYLGPEGTGKLAIIASWVTVLGVFVPLGTSQVIVKEVARDRTKAGALLANGLALRLLMGITAVPIAYLVAWALGYSREMLILLLVSVPGMVVFVLSDVFATIYQGREELARFNRATLLDKVAYGLAVLLLVAFKAPLWMIAGVAILSGLLTFTFYAVGLRDVLKTLTLPRWADLKSLAVASLPFMGLLIFRTLYGQTDPIVLGAVATKVEAGWYATAFKLVGSAMFFPMALVFALLPTLSRLHGSGDHAGFLSLARRALDISLLVGLPISAAAIFLAKPIVQLLYGPSFAGAAPVLAVGGFGMLLYFVTAVLGLLVISLDRQLVQTRSALIACLFGIPLCILFSWGGHQLWGNAALGAIVSDVLVEVYLGVVYWKALPAELFDTALVSRAVRYTLSALLMVLGLWLSLGTSLGLWGILPCMVVYLAACVLLRCWSPAELRDLRGMLVRRPA